MNVRDLPDSETRRNGPARAVWPERRGIGTLREALHTSTFRLLSLFILIVAVSLVALVLFIQCSMTGALQRAIDSGIRWQMRYFDSTPQPDIPALIARRIDRAQRHTTFYGWFDAQGRTLAGNITAVPSKLRLPPMSAGHESDDGQTVSLQLGNTVVSARAMGERRASGQILVIARSLDDVEDIREEVTHAVAVGGALCVVAIVALGVLFGMRQIRRAAAMRRTTLQIAGGELELRLPVEGEDELDMLASLVNRMLDDIERLIREIKGSSDGIAHDLRSPIVRLRIQLGELARHAEASRDDTATRLIGRVMSEADAVLERFTAMLRISEIGTMRRKAGFAPIALAELLDDLIMLYQPLAEEKRIAVVTDLSIRSTVTGDRSLLFEAFSNLMDNAIKFTPEGGAIRVDGTETVRGPAVTISDTGPGIAPDERDAVLRQFYRSSRTRHLPGTGLGLAIVSAIARLHDFRLTIGDTAQPGTGTSITVDCWSNPTA